MTRVFPDCMWSATGWVAEKFSRESWRPVVRHQFLIHPYGLAWHARTANGRRRKLSVLAETGVEIYRGSHAVA